MKNQKDRLEAITSAGWTVELDCNSVTISRGEDILFFDGDDFVEKALECVLYGEVKNDAR